MTWGHKNRCLSPVEGYSLTDSCEGMQMRLIKSCLEMVCANDARCASVGMAWRQVRCERPDYVLCCSDCFLQSELDSCLMAESSSRRFTGSPAKPVSLPCLRISTASDRGLCARD